ncbi:PTS sugar transporter subunit IIC [Longibaculum muris]|uniref:PTS sugar transporter subunit IIC n=1 Tax=Longibaculum muris TaxID=1796628 RepID=UPI0012B86234|nr:PTS transporter subunit EIIC [Longibaculum muris]
MNFFTSFLEQKLVPVMNKISNQRHLGAIRDGLIATIPMTIVGAIALLLATLPWPVSYAAFIADNPKISNVLILIFNMTLGLLSIYVSFGIGKKLAESYGLDSLSGGLIATLSFLTTIGFTTLDEGAFLATSYLGGEGMFTAIITSLFAVEIMHLCDRYNLKIKMPDSVPKNVGSSFDSLIPISISVVIIAIVVHFFGFDINKVISTVITPILSSSSDSVFSPIIYVVLTGLMWFVGIHPAVLAAIMSPVWTVNATANMEMAAAGLAATHTGVQPFIFTFLWIGGGGGTLALCLFMCFSKSKSLKSLGRLALVPSFFNINEPLLFGLPIVLNPILIVPFITAPLICTFITYFAFTSGIVTGMAYPLAAPWNFPSFFAGPICTGDLTGLFLVIVNMIVMGLVYYPFFKIYEKKTLADEGFVEGKE